MKTPLCAADVPVELWYAGTGRELRAWPLCDVGGRARVGVAEMELSAGSNTKPAHWHSREEEHLYVLSGCATLHLGGNAHVLQAGMYVCFPAGQPLAHYIDNTGAAPFRYIMIGERIAADEVTYPTPPETKE